MIIHTKGSNRERGLKASLEEGIPSVVELMKHTIATPVQAGKPSFFDEATEAASLTREDLSTVPVYRMASVKCVVGDLRGHQHITVGPPVLCNPLLQGAASLTYIRPLAVLAGNTVDHTESIHASRFLLAQERSEGGRGLHRNLETGSPQTALHLLRQTWMVWYCHPPLLLAVALRFLWVVIVAKNA